MKVHIIMYKIICYFRLGFKFNYLLSCSFSVIGLSCFVSPSVSFWCLTLKELSVDKRVREGKHKLNPILLENVERRRAEPQIPYAEANLQSSHFNYSLRQLKHPILCKQNQLENHPYFQLSARTLPLLLIPPYQQRQWFKKERKRLVSAASLFKMSPILHLHLILIIIILCTIWTLQLSRAIQDRLL